MCFTAQAQVQVQAQVLPLSNPASFTPFWVFSTAFSNNPQECKSPSQRPYLREVPYDRSLTHTIPQINSSKLK